VSVEAGRDERGRRTKGGRLGVGSAGLAVRKSRLTSRSGGGMPSCARIAAIEQSRRKLAGFREPASQRVLQRRSAHDQKREDIFEHLHDARVELGACWRSISPGKKDDAFGTDVASQCAQMADPRLKDDCVRRLRSDAQLGSERSWQGGASASSSSQGSGVEPGNGSGRGLAKGR
jgi:hypothetical protein